MRSTTKAGDYRSFRLEGPQSATRSDKMPKNWSSASKAAIHSCRG